MTNRIFIALIVGFILYAIGRYVYMKPKFRYGESIPNIEGKLLDGSNFTLSDLKGNYILVDFWGSWCGPCRKENPELTRLYNKYNGKKYEAAEGFEILSIGIETDQQKWKNAIAKDGLIWPYHIVQLDRFSSPIPQSFGVREIPTKYLLSPEGKIVSVNATIDVLDRILAEKLEKS